MHLTAAQFCVGDGHQMAASKGIEGLKRSHHKNLDLCNALYKVFG